MAAEIKRRAWQTKCSPSSKCRILAGVFLTASVLCSSRDAWAAVVVQDSFTETTDTAITSHTPDIGTGWTMVFDNSTASVDAQIIASSDTLTGGSSENNVGQAYTAQPAPSGVDQDISITIKTLEPDNGTKPFGLFGRRTDNLNFYHVQILPNSNTKASVKLFKYDGGVATELGAYDATLAVGTVIKLEIRDATKKVYVDAVERISSTNNDLTSAGTWGLHFGDYNGAGDGAHLREVWQIDDFLAEEPVSDTTAPADITDLATSAITFSSVRLDWTAPGDDGSTGTATSYDIRYSTSAINAGNWASATQVSGEPSPSSAGSSETYYVNGLSASTTYYFAIKTSDEVPNESDVSNSPSATTASPPPSGVRVTQSSDDAEEQSPPGGPMESLGSSDLELGYEGGTTPQEVGMRFQSIAVPQGATITNAYIQFTVDELDSGTTNLTFYGEDEDDTVTFTSTAGDISSRTKTTASVDWNNVPAWDTEHEAGPDQRTPDLSTIIQEIVDRGSWASGNAMVIIASGTGERSAESWDGANGHGNLDLAPLLHIDYTVDSTPPDDVTDLATGTVTNTTIALSWTAPGDDGATGTAATYDVRYSTSPITTGNWASATQASGEPTPSVAGSSESFTVTGLSPSTAYYFAIKTSDEASNESGVSNSPTTTTLADPTITQTGYTWSDDVSTFTSKGNDTELSFDSGTTYILGIQVTLTNSLGSGPWTLQVRENGAGSWLNVYDLSGGNSPVWQTYDTHTFSKTNGEEVLTSEFGHTNTPSGFTSVNGEFSDDNNSLTDGYIGTNIFTELQYAIRAESAAEGNTYEFRVVFDGAVLDAYDVYAQAEDRTISGTVFEDVNYGGGAGRDMATSSGVARSGARVELFTSGGVYSDFTTTDGSGNYSFSGLAAGTYYIRVVNSSVTSSRTGYDSTALPVQTYRTDASSGTASAVTDYVGGTDPSVTDPGDGSTGATFNTSTYDFSAVLSGTAQSVTQCVITASDIADVDFGFNFSTIVNNNDDGQGSLRQFITNANLLSNSGLSQSGRAAGIENAIWMISNGTSAAGLRSANNHFSFGVTTVLVESELPFFVDPIILDARTQPGFAGNPLVQLDLSTSTFASAGLVFKTSGSTAAGFIIHSSTDEGFEIDASAGPANNNKVFGMWLGINASGAAAANADHGVLITDGAANNQIGGTGANERNIISSNSSSGILIRGSGSNNNVVINNWIGVGTDGTTPRGNAQYGIDMQDTVSGNEVGGTTDNEKNIIANNLLDGVGLQSNVGTGNRIWRNSIYGNTKLGINLVAGTEDGYGVTANNGTKNGALPNSEMDHPVFTTVALNGTSLTIAGYVGSAPSQSTFANAYVQIFKSDEDASGFGEGETYLGEITCDANGDFSGSITVAGLSSGDKITGTATDASNSTSEFGPNATVMVKLISGTVYTDEGVTPIADGATVNLLVNGVSVGTDTTTSGVYSIGSPALSADDTLLVFIDDHASKGTTVSISDGNDLSGLDIYAEHVIVRHDNGGALENSDLDAAKNADTDIEYSVSGGALTVGSGVELYIPTGQSFTPGGAVTTQGAGGNVDIRGTITGGANVFTVAGDWDSSSGTFNYDTSTVVLNGTGQTISGSNTFYNLTKSVASADTLTVAVSSTQTVNGTVTLNGASGELLTLASSSPGTHWNFNVAAGATKAISYVSVSWSDASGSDATQKPVNPTNFTDGGDTIDWFGAPDLVVVKSSATLSDPVNATTNPKAIPGAIAEYSVIITNNGDGAADADTLIFTDPIDSARLDYDATTGVTFTDGATSSSIALGTVTFSQTAAPGPYVYDYTPVPDGNGFDGNVTSIKVETTGSFAYGGSPNPSFTLKFRVRLK